MVSIFRNNDVINFVLLLPYAIFLRIYSFIYPATYSVSEGDTIVSKWLFSSISSPLFQSILAVLIVYAQALIINILTNNHRLHRLPTALAGMIYILLVSSIKEFQLLSPALIGMTFILLATFNVFKTYKQVKASPSIFNATFNCALATVIYPPYFILIFAFFIGFLMMRNFSFKERVQFLIGFGVLFWILGSILFYFNILNWSFLDNMRPPGLFNKSTFTQDHIWISLGLTAALILTVLINYYNYMKKKVIDIRKKIDFFYWILLCSFLSLIFYPDLQHQHFLFPAASLAIFLSMSLLILKNKMLAEMLHLISIAAIMYFQFFEI